jgi:hypothetical protein
MGSTLSPSFGSYAAYSPDPSKPYLGLSDPGFLASFGKLSRDILLVSWRDLIWCIILAWFYLCMALFSFISLMCSLRSNIPNVIMFLFLMIQYCLLAGYNWSQAEGKDAIAARIGEVRLIYIRTLNNLSFMLTDYLI